MPKYYKNKIFTEKEKETMWINNLNRGLLWIYGEKVKADDWKTINNLRKYWQKYGREGNGSKGTNGGTPGLKVAPHGRKNGQGNER